jgi:hypothetical protein
VSQKAQKSGFWTLQDCEEAISILNRHFKVKDAIPEISREVRPVSSRHTLKDVFIRYNLKPLSPESLSQI